MMMKLFLLFPLLIALASAQPPKIRLLSVTDQTATIRISEGANEANLRGLVLTLNKVGVNSFVFEAEDDRDLNRLKPDWLDSGIQSVTIKEPEAPSSSTFPKIDPLEAFATLNRIDDELDKETVISDDKRKALVTLIYRHGVPEYKEGTSLEGINQEKEQTEKLLSRYLASSTEERLKIAEETGIPDNPVTRHLETRRTALKKANKLVESGIGPRHPEIKAVTELISSSKQLAIGELSAIEEALQVKIYQLEKKAKHFAKWQKLPASEQEELLNSYQKARSEYEDSLKMLDRLKAMKKAAGNSIPKSE